MVGGEIRDRSRTEERRYAMNQRELWITVGVGMACASLAFLMWVALIWVGLAMYRAML